MTKLLNYINGSDKGPLILTMLDIPGKPNLSLQAVELGETLMDVRRANHPNPNLCAAFVTDPSPPTPALPHSGTMV